MRAFLQKSRALPYVAAVVIAASTVGIRLMMDPHLGHRALLLPFTLAVIVAGWYGGFGPGLFATLLSAAGVSLFWMPPLYSIFVETPGDRLELGIFIAAGIAISALYQAIAASRKRVARYAAELQKREELHRRILETATEGIGALDSDGNIVFANSSMARILGVPRSEILGHGAFDFLDTHDREEAVRRFYASLSGERTAFETLLRRRDQAPVWVHVSSAPMPDSEGVLIMFADVSARIRAEQERERLFDSEKKARKEAEAANAAKDEFLAAVSHELRTPLTAMLGWLSMMRAGTLDDAKRERALDVIERNARSQAKLIEDLLDVSRMTSGTLRLEQRCIALGEVLQSAMETVGPIAVEKEIHVERRLDATSDIVWGDPERLKQIVVNLLTNAVRFTQRGGRINLSLEDDAQGELAIVVEDDGQGIPPNFLPHVFDRFRQQDGGITRKHGGLGLGLTIARHLVERHGGRISADSKGLGHGAKFVVSLPRLSAADRAHFKDARHVDSENTRLELGRLGDRRLLVVDDEKDSLDMLRELLAGAGAIVRTASSAKEALSSMSDFRPDLILSDLAMPDEDGYDFIANVRSLPSERGGRTPAIALTAHARTTDRVGVLTSGFQAYLAKPVEPDELIATAGRLLGAKNGTRLDTARA
jgi:PAS domain S-box-containing protein